MFLKTIYHAHYVSTSRYLIENVWFPYLVPIYIAFMQGIMYIQVVSTK